MTTFEVPGKIMKQFLLGVLAHEVPLTLRHTTPGGLAIVSDQLGDVLAWLWKADADQAVMFVADYLAQVRYHHDNANKSITLNQLLDGLQGILPPEEREALVARCRQEVPRYFDDDVTRAG